MVEGADVASGKQPCAAFPSLAGAQQAKENLTGGNWLVMGLKTDSGEKLWEYEVGFTWGWGEMDSKGEPPMFVGTPVYEALYNIPTHIIYIYTVHIYIYVLCVVSPLVKSFQRVLVHWPCASLLQDCLVSWLSMSCKRMFTIQDGASWVF